MADDHQDEVPGAKTATANRSINVAREEEKRRFACHLEKLMVQRNFNQAELARATKNVDPRGEGLGRDSINQYVRGRSLPEPKANKLLADALGVTVSELRPAAKVDAATAELPLLEMRELSANPGLVRLRMDRKLRFTTAAKIVSLIDEDGV